MPRCVEFLQTDEAQSALAFATDSDINDIKNKMSDFERFAFAASNLSLFTGNAFFEHFTKALLTDVGYPHDVLTLKDREEQKKIWRFINGDGIVQITPPTLEIKGTADDFKITKFKHAKLCDHISSKRIFLLNSALENSCELRQNTLLGTIESVSEYCRINDVDTLFVDLENISFVNPDPFHTELSYRKITSGEFYNSEDTSIVLLWLLSSASLKISPKIELKISNIENSLKLVENITDYVKKRGRCRQVSVCFELPEKQEVSAISKLCIKKNISPKIIISEEIDENAITERLNALVYELPIARIELLV